jgi:hypothetical protein
MRHANHPSWHVFKALFGLNGRVQDAVWTYVRVWNLPFRVDAWSMLFAGVALICFLSLPLAGARMGRLAEVEPRGVWIAVAGLLLQIAIISVVPGGDEGLHTAVHLSSYLLVGWVVWANRHVPWLWLVGAGGLLNFVAIVANGGVMPASASAAAAAGVESVPNEFVNSQVLPEPHLLFLGDVFGSRLPWPLPNNVFSVGDIVMAVGAFLLLHTVCESRLALPLRRRAGQLA